MNPMAPQEGRLNDRRIDYFKAHEGVVSHLYLDTVGLVTVGIGRMLPSPGDCATLGFVRLDGSPAVDEEKREEWLTVKAMEKGHVASFYEPHCKLRLPESAIDAEFYRVLGCFIATLKARWAQFESFPESAQLGLLDMVYSLGQKGFLMNYPRMCAAVDMRDWRSAAAQCARRGVSASRNADCAGLFTACLA